MTENTSLEQATQEAQDAAKREEKRQRAAQARALLDALAQRYPACFTRDRDQVRPLAIGIQQKLRAELAGDDDLKETPGWMVRQALAIYTRSPAYFRAIIDKRPRINLDGSVAGEVTEQEQAHASSQLEAWEARRAARRPQRPKPQPGKPRRGQRPRRSEPRSGDAPAAGAERQPTRPKETRQRRPETVEEQRPQESAEERTRRKLEALAAKFSRG